MSLHGTSEFDVEVLLPGSIEHTIAVDLFKQHGIPHNAIPLQLAPKSLEVQAINESTYNPYAKVKSVDVVDVWARCSYR